MSIFYFSKKNNMLLNLKQLKFTLCISFILFTLFPKSSFSQPVYGIAVESSAENKTSRLVEYHPEIGYTKYIADLDGNIRGLAIDPVSGKIYTIRYNEFGTLNPLNGEFEKISDLGTMRGKIFESERMIEVLPDSIRCMAFDAANDRIYAVDYNYDINGATIGSEDLLFAINPNTGAIIKDLLYIDGNASENVDFVTIETVESTTNQGSGSPEPIRDVWDISINPETGELCSYHRFGIYAFLAYLNPETGKREADIEDLSFKDYLGFSFSRDGSSLLFTSGKGIPTQEEDPTILKQRQIYGNELDETTTAGFVDAEVFNFKTIDYGLTNYFQYTPCQLGAELDVTNMIQPDSVYISSSVINSNLYVNKDTEFRAGEEINMIAGFEISVNPSDNSVPNFTATIADCN